MGSATHVAPVPRTAESAEERMAWEEKIERSGIERETRDRRRESRIGFVPCIMMET